MKNINNRNAYNTSKIRNVLNSVYKKLDNNKKVLNDAIEKDKNNGNKIEFEKIKEIIKEYLNYKEVISEDDIKSQKIDGIGNVAVIFDGRPEIMAEMAIKCLLTNNNVTFFPNLDMATTVCLITIFEESMREIQYENNFIVSKDDIEELYKNQDEYDLAVFIGDKYEYFKFKKKFLKDIIYNSFGSIQIYSDSEYFDKDVEKISDYAFKNNYVALKYDDEDIDENLKQMNEITVTDIAAIFTKDSKKALHLVKNIKARKIYVNTFPFDNYTFEFDETKLLLKKQIITG